MMQKHAQQVIEFCPFCMSSTFGTSIEVITAVAKIQYLNGLSKISPKFCERCTHKFLLWGKLRILLKGKIERSYLSCVLMKFEVFCNFNPTIQ